MDDIKGMMQSIGVDSPEIPPHIWESKKKKKMLIQTVEVVNAPAPSNLGQGAAVTPALDSVSGAHSDA